jgi:hypothetical protein
LAGLEERADAQVLGDLDPSLLPCEHVEQKMRLAGGGVLLMGMGRAFESLGLQGSDEEEDAEQRVEDLIAPLLPYLTALDEKRKSCGLPELTWGKPLGAAAPSASSTPTPMTSAHVDTAEGGASLTEPEKNGLRLGVQRCWNAPADLRDAHELKVTLSAELAASGDVINASIRPIEPLPMPDARFQQLYEAGRRALIRCSPYGDLPREKYAQWRNIEVVFNPEGMVSW